MLDDLGRSPLGIFLLDSRLQGADHAFEFFVGEILHVAPADLDLVGLRARQPPSVLSQKIATVTDWAPSPSPCENGLSATWAAALKWPVTTRTPAKPPGLICWRK